MSRNDFFTFGIGNGKMPSLFLPFGIENKNEKKLGLEKGSKNLIPTFWDWEWE